MDFSTFIMSLASAVYIDLGLIVNPMTNKKEKNLFVAKQHIDLIEMLKIKTKGNLSDDENKMIESILYQLHMAYVEANKNEEKKS